MAEVNKKDKGSNAENSVSKQGGPKIPDIRRVRPGKVSPVYGFLIVLTILSLIFSVWFVTTQVNLRGKEVGQSEIVKLIVDEEYKEILFKNEEVILIQEGNKRVYAKMSPDFDLYSRLEAEGVTASMIKKDSYESSVNVSATDVISIVLLLAGLGLIFMMVRGMQSSGGKLLDFGQSKARLMFGKKTGISFDDVAGIDDVKEELVELVDFLRNPKKYSSLGARIPKGVLLVGAPGTGKTLLAKAVAGEAGVPFFHTSGSEFEEMLVGAGASRVRDLFAKAKKASPCIIFIDEIDAVAKKRGTVVHSGAGEQTLNQILVEMDGLEERENVIVLAATNRPDVLDPAILRPGRFDRSVTVNLPDKEGRLKILEVHSANKKYAADVDLEAVARKTIGYSGADLENLLNEAAIMAAGNGQKEISRDNVFEAYLKVKLGRKRATKNNIEDDLRRIAYHEAGHAIAAYGIKGSTPVERISILPRGGSGGVTVYLPEDERSLYKKSQLYAQIVIACGGKVAEEVFLDEMTTGASSDIRQVTEIARSMVQRYGMSEAAGFLVYGNAEDSTYLGYQYGSSKEYSESTAQLIDSEVRKLVDRALEESKEILKKYTKEMHKLAEMLLDKEEVSGEEFLEIFAK